ncbi:MAG: peptidylprolyl isomerase [Smithellaceae bacterium]|nr:peptidylprolyl isomerase [Smithellaceae bacterium]
MNKFLFKSALAIFMPVLVVSVFACDKINEAASKSDPAALQSTASESILIPEKPAAETPPPAIAPASARPLPADTVVSVDGVTLKKDALNKIVQTQMKLYQDRIPADRKEEVQVGLEKQLTEDFVMRTLLANEAKRKNIAATDKEISVAMEQIKANIPPDKSLKEFMKENNVSSDDIAMGVRIQKLVTMETGGKTKPTEKEIGKFYADNKDKFTTEESVHVRHILVAIDAKDDEKVRAEKKAKTEDLRRQITAGADFAEVAKKNSDCPSKEDGGDLGKIRKGQTVKPFEDAAFSQKIQAVGPVVSTEFGHHIIQVLERTTAHTVSLSEVKEQIALYLEQQKQAETFSKMMTRLKKNAVIQYGKP